MPRRIIGSIVRALAMAKRDGTGGSAFDGARAAHVTARVAGEA
jgi:hypothetical protein